MNFLPKIIRFKGKEDFCPFHLPEIEDLCGDFFGSHARSGVYEWSHEVPERCCLINNRLQNLFFFGLEREVRNFGLPIEQLF